MLSIILPIGQSNGFVWWELPFQIFKTNLVVSNLATSRWKVVSCAFITARTGVVASLRMTKSLTPTVPTDGDLLF